MMIPSRHSGAESDDGAKATTDTHFRMHTPRPPPHRNQRTEKSGAFETPQLKGGATCCCSDIQTPRENPCLTTTAPGLPFLVAGRGVDFCRSTRWAMASNGTEKSAGAVRQLVHLGANR